jgi:hypothetical protein
MARRAFVIDGPDGEVEIGGERVIRDWFQASTHPGNE